MKGMNKLTATLVVLAVLQTIGKCNESPKITLSVITSRTVTFTLKGNGNFNCTLKDSEDFRQDRSTMKVKTIVKVEFTGLTPGTRYKIACKGRRTNESLFFNTGLPPVTGLMALEVDSKLTVNSTHFNQTIEWTEVSSHNQNISYYIVNYQMENYNGLSVQNTTLNSATLTLPLPTSPTTYNVWVAAVSDSTGTGEYSEVLKINYTAPTEPMKLNVSKQTNKQCNRLKLTWKEPRNTGGLPIISYQITYRKHQGGEIINNTIVSGKTMTTLTNLLPGTTYSIEVRANNSIISNAGAIVNKTTKSKGASNVVMANVSSHTTISVSRTKDQKYICWLNGTTNNYTLNTSSIEVGGLTPDTVYSIGCVKVDEAGHYQCMRYTTTVVTGLSQVADLKVLQSVTVDNSHFNQSIEWKRVTSDNQNISHYIIKYGLSPVVNSYDSEGVSITTSTTNSATLTLPLPTSPTTYNVWVAAVSGKSVTGEYSEMLEINYTASTEPRNLTMSGQKCNKLSMTWDEPMDTGGLPIINYQITYRKDPGGEIINDTIVSEKPMTTLTKLLPGTTYSIEVRANNSIISNASAVVNETTTSRDASNVVMAKVTTHSTINVSRTTDLKYICWVNDTTNNFTLNTSSIEVDKLKPDTVHSIGCVEVDEDGDYQCTEFNTTLETGLSQVADLKVLRSVTVDNSHFNQSIEWKRVTSDNQNISHYIIKYGLSPVVNSYDSEGVSNTTSTTNSATLTLPLPTSPTTYNVWVAAVSGKSVTGEYSEVLEINYTASTEPMNLTVSGQRCNQLNLTWDKPMNTGGLPIINYLITYRKDPGGEIINDTIVSEKLMTILTNLLPGTTYSIEVRASNSIISNASADINITTTSRGASNVVLANVTSHTTINVSQTMDKKYICWVNDTSYTLNKSSIEVDEVVSDMKYSIGCVEVDEDGDYQCTEYNTTVVTGLPQVTDLKVLKSVTVNNTHFNQSIGWNKVISVNQNISHYIIKYGLSSDVNSSDSEGVSITISTTNSATLPLPLPKSPTTYNVWVAAVSDSTGTGEYSKVLKINYTAPTEPRSLNVSNMKCNQLKLIWDKPMNTGGLPITNYQITYRKDPGEIPTLSMITKQRMTTLQNLLPNTSYMITVRANNSIMSDTDAVVNVNTKPRRESDKVMVNVTSSLTFNIISRNMNKKYICWVNGTTHNYILNTSSIEVGGLTPDTVYSIGCVEVDEDGYYQCTEYNITAVTGLSQVTDLKVLQSTAVDNTQINQSLEWNKVTSDNQDISHYTIKYGLASVVNSYDSEGVNSKTSTTNSASLILSLPRSAITYNVWVAAVSGESVIGKYSEVFKINYTAPRRPTNLTAFGITCNQLNLTWEAPGNTGGLPIINYEIKYREDPGGEITTVTSTEPMVTLDNLLPETTYEIEVRANNSILNDTNTKMKKITTERIFGASDKVMAKVTSSMTLNISQTTDKKYTCWVNGTTNNYTLNTSSIEVGGLTPDTVYSIGCVEVDEDGHHQCTEYNTTVVTETLGETDFEYWIIAVAIAAGSLLLAVVCGICVILIVVCVRDQKSKGTYNFNEEAICLQDIVAAVMDDSIIALQNMQRKDPIPKHLFSDHVRSMHHDKDKDFKAEFAGITKEPPVSKRHAEANGTKNRYVNVYAYDYCRVVLSDPHGTDYINAAFIDGYKKPKCYIAAQGPTLNTIMDFWEMIWEQKSTIIVMLTRLVEGGKTKCEQYWSEEHNAPYQPGRDLIVTTTSHKVMPGFEIREFSLTKESDASDPLLVKHFLYTAWPDHGVPQYSSSMVKFILQQIKLEMEKTTAPIVVHCSAGAGRTGTFIAIDTALDRLEEEDNINIFECVEMMRTKRTQMVQTAVQYIYIHDAINDHVACGDTAIVAQELGQKIAQFNRMEPGAKSTGLEEQFYVLEGICPETCRIDRDFGERPEVKARNRYSNLHTYSDNYIETEDDKTYVNATLIPGYYGQSGFIAAQAPLKNTIEDTWNVIREQNCSVVVVLGDFVELGQEMCEPFWPTEVGVPMTIGRMKISLMNTLQSEHYDVYELTITVEVTGDVIKIEIHHYKAWNKYGHPDVSSLLKLMGDVQKSQQKHTGPVMVMCDDGMSRTGVFITVMSEIDRVKVEGEMDIFHTVKAARTARPYMVSTVYDYELCHEIGLNYLESFDSYASLKV